MQTRLQDIIELRCSVLRVQRSAENRSAKEPGSERGRAQGRERPGDQPETKGRRVSVLICSQRDSPHPYAPLAQLVEQLTLNQWVPGSSP